LSVYSRVWIDHIVEVLLDGFKAEINSTTPAHIIKTSSVSLKATF